MEVSVPPFSKAITPPSASQVGASDIVVVPVFQAPAPFPIASLFRDCSELKPLAL